MYLLYYLVPKSDLGELCTSREQCLDTNAECDGGLCTCKQRFVQDQDTCGKYINISVHQFKSALSLY